MCNHQINGIRFLMLFACVAGCSAFACAQSISVRVAAGDDDAEEHTTEGNTIDLGSSDLELGAEGGGTDLQEVGIRFRNVNIPSGSFIGAASVQFTVDETDDEDTSVRIFGELSPDPVEYSSAVADITSRAKTTAFVDWNDIPIWNTVGVAGPDQQTPDLTSIIEEILAQPGWAPGNAMAFIIAPNPGGERTAESFNGAANSAALLEIKISDLPIVPGDVTGDGLATAEDFQVILQNFLLTGAKRSQGDLNFDENVNFPDFRAWKNVALGRGQGQSGIPEPGCLLLALVAAPVLLGNRRRPQQT